MTLFPTGEYDIPKCTNPNCDWEGYGQFPGQEIPHLYPDKCPQCGAEVELANRVSGGPEFEHPYNA
jgi:hypothetical protein